ncbi:SAM-dependent methyltransferase [Paenibacillus sp. 598K]|uniref:class I SAM-dependent methyltransferase n=1 Tax=Paenibacillus sp. 598K TaxID=1117987 RepID=UPI000FFA2324|nr:class I SAM-dependent methyltransferase [Paenibacillus sp. 598K]GBF74815.1 SAM-dependent methyltransferase [Paenibacillus sp. 598K]
MTNPIPTLFDPAIWEQAWREDADTAARKMQRAGVDPTRSFDQKAIAFDRETFSAEGRKRARRIIGWLEDQGVKLEGARVLDIGAASGGFAVPFAEKGASVTAVETSPPQVKLLEERRSQLTNGAIDIVSEPFETIDLEERGWSRAFDLVFVSMCPVLHDWASIERLLSCARGFCYMSTMVGQREHSLLEEVWPLVTDRPRRSELLEMSYLMNLLLLHGYAFQSLITRESKTTVYTQDEALGELMPMLRMFGASETNRLRGVAQAYVQRAYPEGEVTVRQGGRFGKVLVRLQDQHMYSREEERS